ncbi:APOV1 protein, partial [Bucco capensis]|nr:APOV1 protein [Bucco capensis]
MLQSRALVIALILLLGTTLPEVQSKSIFDKDRRDWLVYPDAVASYIYDLMSKIYPKGGQFLADIAQTQAVVVTRNFLMKETAKLSMLAEQVAEKIKAWYAKVLGY